MPAFADYRFNPFTNTHDSVVITNEIHTIPSSSPFTIRLKEVPQKDSPSSVKIRITDNLTAAITTVGQATCIVANGAWFTINNIITIDAEQILVTGVAGNTLSISRGYGGTTATTHLNGAQVFIEASMVEVAANPGAKQFWPDYSTGADNDENWNTGKFLFYSTDGGKQISVDYKGLGTLMDNRVVPRGIIVAWNYAISLIPYGWALCDGTNGTPDLNGRVILGAGVSYSVDATGGETTHALTISEMPLHDHPGNWIISGDIHAVGYNVLQRLWQESNDQTITSTTTVAPQGGGAGHNNMPPYIAKAWIMKL